MALTVDELLQHMGFDERDAQIVVNATSALEDAEAYLKSAIGEDLFDLLPEDPKVTRLWKIYATDFYDNRSSNTSTSAKTGNAKSAMVHDLEWQLKMELSRAREEAGA